MNPLTSPVRFGAHALLAGASLLLALRSAAAADPAAAEQRPLAAKAEVSTTVAAVEPAPQRPPSAANVANSDANTPAQPPALDWSYTPRRSLPAKRR